MKNVLCVMSDVGGAHRTVAENIGRSLERQNGTNDFRYNVVDIFKECSPFCNFWIKRYSMIIENFSWFYKGFYHFTDTMSTWNFMYKTFILPHMREKMMNVLLRNKPGLMLSTFALSGRISVDVLKDLNLFPLIPVVIVVVDLFTIHRAWAEPRAHLTIVPTKEAAAQLISYGVPENKIQICKYAVRDFTLDSTILKKDLKLKDDRLTVMILCGGEGSRDIYHSVNLLLKSTLPVQILAVTGRNKHVYDKLIALGNHPHLKVFGYSNNVLELMKLSDILITKAGPATLMEAFSVGLPVIINSWVPGQEEGNVLYVKSKRLGYVIEKKHEIIEIIQNLISSKNELLQLKSNICAEHDKDKLQEIATVLMDKFAYLK